MLTLQSLLAAAVVGALAGTYASIRGMYKDSIYQGFGAGRFAGSVVVGIIVAIALASALQFALSESAALILLFGLTYAAERGIYESWKTFVATQDQSDLFIPTITICGVLVAARIVRIASGIVFVIAIGLFLFALAQVDRSASGPPTPAKSAFAGLVGGAIVAAGGAWRNAPREGFQRMRFIRSPFMTIAFALLLSFLTQSYLYLAVAAIGYERAAVETWKTVCAYVAFRFSNGPWA